MRKIMVEVPELEPIINFLKVVALGEYSENLIRERAGLLVDRFDKACREAEV